MPREKRHVHQGCSLEWQRYWHIVPSSPRDPQGATHSSLICSSPSSTAPNHSPNPGTKLLSQRQFPGMVKLHWGLDHHSYIHQSSPCRSPWQCCTSTCLHPEANMNPPAVQSGYVWSGFSNMGKSFSVPSMKGKRSPVAPRVSCCSCMQIIDTKLRPGKFVIQVIQEVLQIIFSCFSSFLYIHNLEFHVWCRPDGL